MSTLISDVLDVGFETVHLCLRGWSISVQGDCHSGNEKTGRVEEKSMQTLANLTDDENKRKECDIKVANIILQGLPNDIYTLLNHMKTTNVIWYRVKALMEGTQLTKQGRETKLPDEFEKFTLEKGETIQSYYLRFPKLINGININGFEMKTIQINTNVVYWILQYKLRNDGLAKFIEREND
ncbi:hypothetical protein Tco_0535682 [Tanacetum coccineum]